MTIADGIRLVTLVMAAAVTAAGVMIVVGLLNRPGMTPELRMTVGAVAVLYGVYKFVITWFRRTGSRES
jgi:hypothetical protein